MRLCWVNYWRFHSLHVADHQVVSLEAPLVFFDLARDVCKLACQFFWTNNHGLLLRHSVSQTGAGFEECLVVKVLEEVFSLGYWVVVS